jgi:hypothetical protein
MQSNQQLALRRAMRGMYYGGATFPYQELEKKTNRFSYYLYFYETSK